MGILKSAATALGMKGNKFTQEELEKIRKRLANKKLEEEKENLKQLGFTSPEKETVEKETVEKETPPSLVPWGGGETQMQANFVKNEEGDIVEGTGGEKRAAEKTKAHVDKTNEDFGGDNVTKISEFFNTDVENLEITKSTLTDAGNIYMVKHKNLLGDKSAPDYFDERHFVEILEDGTVSFRTENEVKDKDKNFFNKTNKDNKEDYYSDITNLTYFDEFNTLEGASSYSDKFDEDTVVDYLDPILKKYGIKVYETGGMLGVDHITLKDANGNTKLIPLGMYRSAGDQGPLIGGDLLKRNSGSRIKSAIESFIKSNGKQWDGDLEFKESTI